MRNITFVLGTRPQFIKFTPLIHLMEKRLNLFVINTGQHYDYEMAKMLFEDLALPDPDINLNVGSGTHAQQIARIMMRLEKILKNRSDLVVVPGDTNSTLAGALTGAHLDLPIAHIEAGARSYDMTMPEEVNRRLTDHCSSLLFSVSDNCTKNLLKEGIGNDRIHQVGDTLYDLLLHAIDRIQEVEFQDYMLLTLHRPENVDDEAKLRSILKAMADLRLTIVFPVHPRTMKQLRKFRIKLPNNIRVLKPVGYHKILALIKNARIAITDSGGIQKEAFWLRTPCVTIRRNTEWTETLALGVNRLVEANADKIVDTVKQSTSVNFDLPNPYGDGQASQRILNVILEYS